MTSKPSFFSSIIVKESYRFMAVFCSSLLGIVFLLPLALVLPKKKGRCAVIGRERGTFSDNCKHCYLAILKSGQDALSVKFISSSKRTIDKLRNHSLPCLFYPGIRSLYWLLTTEFIIIDSAEWISGGKFQLAAMAKTIQLWHGAPLKEIELPLYRKRLQKLSLFPRLILQIQKKIIGRYPKYYAVMTTSVFFSKKAFVDAFRGRYFLAYGYPRNDALLKVRQDKKRHSPLWINCDHEALLQIDAARLKRQKVILYAPTFRSDLSSPFDGHLSLELLDRYGAAHNFLFVMKLHPLMAGRVQVRGFSHIIEYAPDADVYPALPLMDCLITDYSSIYFDYLLLDRPIIFFPYDFQQYVKDERALLFNYQEMAPGKHCFTMEELKEALTEPDTIHWKEHRKTVRDKVFDFIDDQAGTRLVDFLISGEVRS